MMEFFNPRPAHMSHTDPMSSNYDPGRCEDENAREMGYGKYRDDGLTIYTMKEQPTKLSDYDKDHIAQILTGEGSWFMAKLCRLIANADKQTKKQLYAGFPDAVDAVHKYQTGKSWTEGKL